MHSLSKTAFYSVRSKKLLKKKEKKGTKHLLQQAVLKHAVLKTKNAAWTLTFFVVLRAKSRKCSCNSATEVWPKQNILLLRML